MIIATKKWIFLKISGALLIPLMLWFTLNLISIYDQGYNEVMIFFTSSSSKFLFSVFIIDAYFFSALSISEVFEDYIQNEQIKSVANKLLYASAVAIPIITIILIPLMLWFIINFVSIFNKEQGVLVSFFSNQPSKFLFSLFLVFAYFFSALSISEVFEDYIQDEKIKNVANKILKIFAILMPLITILGIFNLTI